MRQLLLLGQASKVLAYIILAGGAGFVLGDEISQRFERAKMRNACYEIQASQVMEMNERIELSLRYQCRVNIP